MFQDSDLPVLEMLGGPHYPPPHHPAASFPGSGPGSVYSRSSPSFPHSHPPMASSNEISAIPTSPVPLIARSPSRFSHADRDETSSKASRKRSRKSSVPSMSDSAKIQSLAVRRNTYLSLIQNFVPFRLEMKPVQIYSHAPSISIRVWLIGFNTDPTSGILRRKDGLHLYFQYSQHSASPAAARSAPVYSHSENLNQAALCSLFARIAGNSLLFPEFHGHLQSKRPISQLLGKFHVTSHRQLLYRNTDGDYKFLHDLLPSSFAFKLKTNIPASVAKVLRPIKDNNLQIDRRVVESGAAQQELSDTESEDNENDDDGERDDSETEEETIIQMNKKKSKSSQSIEEEKKKNKEKEKNREKEKEKDKSSGKSKENEREKERESKSKRDKDSKSRGRSRSRSPSSDSSESSASVPAAPSVSVPSPFSRYSFMCIHWRLHSSESGSSSSSLFSELAKRNIGVQEIADGTDLEYLLTQIRVRVLAALNAPVIAPNTSISEKIDRILSYLPSSAQANPAAFQATPLRVDDSCIILLPRALFDQRVWPLLIATMPMFELTPNTQLEFLAQVKSEPGATAAAQPQNGKDSSIMLARRVVAQFVRTTCKGTSFWLYSLPSPSVESQFFAPIQANCLYSLESGSPLHKPVLLEWPRGMPFEPAIPLHWARFCIQPAGPGHTQKLLVSVPAVQWGAVTLRTMQNALESPTGAPGNLVKLLRVAVSAQPIPVTSSGGRSRDQKVLIDSDATYLVLEMLVSQAVPLALQNNHRQSNPNQAAASSPSRSASRSSPRKRSKNKK